jgi:hypothetical protein
MMRKILWVGLTLAAIGASGLTGPASPAMSFAVALAYDGRDSAVTLSFNNGSQEPVTNLRLDELSLFGNRPAVPFPVRIDSVGGGVKGRMVFKFPGSKFQVNDDTTVRLRGGYEQGTRRATFTLDIPLFPDRRHF